MAMGIREQICGPADTIKASHVLGGVPETPRKLRHGKHFGPVWVWRLSLLRRLLGTLGTNIGLHVPEKPRSAVKVIDSSKGALKNKGICGCSPGRHVENGWSDYNETILKFMSYAIFRVIQGGVHGGWFHNPSIYWLLGDQQPAEKNISTSVHMGSIFPNVSGC